MLDAAAPPPRFLQRPGDKKTGKQKDDQHDPATSFFFNGTLMASEWLRVRLLGFFLIGPSGEPVKLG